MARSPVRHTLQAFSKARAGTNSTRTCSTLLDIGAPPGLPPPTNAKPPCLGVTGLLMVLLCPDENVGESQSKSLTKHESVVVVATDGSLRKTPKQTRNPGKVPDSRPRCLVSV